MFRSILVAFMAFLVVGQARDKAGLDAPTGEQDRAKGVDQLEGMPGVRWALSRETRAQTRAPVSEL